MNWLTPKQHLRRLRWERFKDQVRKISLVLFFLFTLWFAINLVITSCTSSEVVDRLNECLKTHDLNYCNKEVK